MSDRSGRICEYSMNSRDDENWHRTEAPRRLGGDEWTARREDGTHEWRCPHLAVEGENRCLFHLPAGHERKDPERQNHRLAELVASRPERRQCEDRETDRPREFVGAEFVDLDLSGVSLEAPRGATLNLKHAVFSGTTDVSGTAFHLPVQASGATFEGELRGQDARFGGQAGFVGAVFRRQVNFNSARFLGHTRFTDATFERRAIFNYATFGSRVEFERTDFWTEAGFRSTDFLGPAQFNSERKGIDARETRFLGPARFDGASFAEDCHFIQVVFAGSADFSGGSFADYTGFSGSRFGREVNFEKAVFEDRNYFRGIETGGPVRFAGCKFVGEGFFEEADLAGAEFRDAVLADVTFGEAMLGGATFRAADLTGTGLNRADLTGADLEEAVLDRTDLRGADLRGTLWYHAFFADVRLNESTRFGATAKPGGNRVDGDGTCQYERLARGGASGFDAGEDIIERSETDLWNQAAWTYNRLEQVFRENAMSRRALAYHYRKGEADRIHFRKRGRWDGYLVLWIHRLLTGYGDRFLPVFAWSLVTVVVSALLYLVFGLRSSSGEVYRGIVLTTPAGREAILVSLQFSIGTFGFGSMDTVAVGYSNVVAVVESMLGTFLFGLVAFVLARRLP